MRVSRLRDLGLATVLFVATAACTPAATAPPSTGADVAVRAYSPPSGVPGFCALLADSTHLTDLPEAVGTLTVEPGDVEAKLLLTAAISELDDVLAVVREHPGFLALDRSVDELLTTLRDARDGGLTETARTAIASRLDDIGHPDWLAHILARLAAESAEKDSWDGGGTGNGNGNGRGGK